MVVQNPPGMNQQILFQEQIMNLLILLGAFLPSNETVIKGEDFKLKNGEIKLEILQAQDVKIKSGDCLKIQLPANSGTGYTWQLMGQEFGPLTLKQAGTLPNKKSLPGAREVHEFEFTTNQIGKGITSQVVLIFNLRRSFEGVGEKFHQVRVLVGE